MTLGSGRRRLPTALGALAFLFAASACSEGDDGDATASTTTTEAQGPSGELSVLTYNVAGLPQEVSQENPKDHIPLISPRLESFDVVMTQEDFDWWQPALDGLDFVHYHERLRAAVTHEYRSAKHPGPEAAGLDPSTRPLLSVGDGLGFLSRFPLEDEERIAWHGCFGTLDTSDGGAADCPAMKGFAAVTLVLGAGLEVDVYTLHAEAGGTEEDQRLQGEDFEQLAAYIDTRSPDRAIILGGDTNLHTSSDHPDASDGADTRIWEDFLHRSGLDDACTVLECREIDSIDKIAFRSSAAVTLVPLSHDFPSDDFEDDAGEPLSDHEPLAVRFRWSAPR